MGRSPCCEKTHTNKGAWTKEEDQRLINYIRLHGEGCWRSLPTSAGLLRCGKSCRLRWINYLRPDLKRGNFTEDEDELIIKLHGILGNKWSLIAAKLPGRTDNEIKNYWNTHIKRKLISRGLDPQTHRSCNSTTAATPTANAIATTSLDFRKNTSTVPSKILPCQNYTTLPSNNLNSVYKFKTESIEEGNCSSSTTEETQQQQYHHHKEHDKPVLDLELSIGLPASTRTDHKTGSAWDGVKMVRPPTLVAPRVCLCWQLGFQNKAGEFCSNCRSSTTAFYSYC